MHMMSRMLWTLICFGQASALYKWYPTAGGSVKIIDIESSYVDAENFCHTEGAAGILPLALAMDMGLLSMLNNKLAFWVSDPANHTGNPCNVISYDHVGRWLPEKNPCGEKNPFLCAQTLPLTSSEATTIIKIHPTSQPMNVHSLNGTAFTKTWIPAPSGHYSIVNEDLSHENASLYCQKLNSGLSPSLNFTEFRQNLAGVLNSSLAYWVEGITAYGAPTCSILRYSVNRWTTSSADCDEEHLFICKHNNLGPSSAVNTTAESKTSMVPAPTTTAVSVNAFSIITVNDSVLYVDYDAMTYQNASRFCQLNFSGSLAASDLVLSVGSALGKYISGNFTYWLQGKANRQCQILNNVENSSTWNTSSDQCSRQLPFICKGSYVTSNSTPVAPLTTTSSQNATPTISRSTNSSLSSVSGWHKVGDKEYRISDHSCYYFKSDRCCQEVGGTLSPTLDRATLSEVARVLPKYGYDGKLWINGTSCILGHVASDCDILAFVKGAPVYSQSSVKEKHLCLCQRSSFRDRATCKEFYRHWERIGSLEYWKSGKPREYWRAEKQCNRDGGGFVDKNRIQSQRLIDVLQLSTRDGSFWIKSENATSTCYACSVYKQQPLLTNKSCISWLYSICERPISTSVTTQRGLTSTKTSNFTTVQTITGWKRNRRHEYYVTDDFLENMEAESYCRDNLDSSLTFFTMTTHYLKLVEILGLDPGEYWVGVGIEPVSDESCLLLRVQDKNSASLSPADCADHYRSICRRPVKNETMTFEPEFLEMLVDLAVTGKPTHKQQRKMTSATDFRSSSKAMGIVGVGMIVLVSSVIVGFDISNFKGCPKRRRRTVSTSNA